MSLASALSARTRRRRPTPLTRPLGPASEHRRAVLSELERLLNDPGCPACAYAAEAERSFFSWFVIETSTAVEVQARLRASLGMCPPHSRVLVDEIGEGPVLTRVTRQGLAGAGERLDGEPTSRCPACDAGASVSEHFYEMLIDGLRDPANAQSYREHPGMCMPHVLEVAASAEPSILRLVCERLLASLHDRRESELALLAGGDRDASSRARWRDRLPEDPIGASTIDALCARFAIETCPVCLSRGQMDRSYVRWLVQHSREHDHSVARDPGELCSLHLQDLHLADPDVGAEAMRRKRASRVGRLSLLLQRLDELSPPRRGRQGPDDRLRRPLEEFTRAPHCPACQAGEAIEHRQLELTGASLALDAVRDRYERGHGLCFRHAMRLREPHPAQVARRHLGARLAVLAWEVDEAARKCAWASRHELPGPEQDAWLRALAQIDGRVFEGAPAPADVQNRLPEKA